MNTKGLNANQLKIIAMIAMTIDHLVAVIYPILVSVLTGVALRCWQSWK